MSRITTARPRHLRSDEAYAEVKTAHAEGREISDACALTIASWWQSSGYGGRAFAELASTGSVDVDALSRDIAATYVDAEAVADVEALALDMLGTWALNHASVTR